MTGWEAEQESAEQLLDADELSKYRPATGVGTWWICDVCSAVIQSRAKHTLWHERTRS